MAEAVIEKRNELVKTENERLNDWLKRLVKAQSAMQEFVGDNKYAHFNGMMQRFVLVEGTELSVTPKKKDVTLDKVDVRNGMPNLETSEEYTRDDPFTGGWALQADLEETDAPEQGSSRHGYIGFELLGIEKGYCPEGVIIPGILLPQVAIVVADGRVSTEN